jgi:hypothetical protein
MKKADLQIGDEYAWQEQYGRHDEYRRVTLVEFHRGVQLLVRDADGEFETTTHRLFFPWSELPPKAKEAQFRTSRERWEHEQRKEQERDPEGYEIRQLFQHSTFEPGKGGVPRVPGSLPRVFEDLSSGVLKLELGEGRREDEQIACFQMLRTLLNVCERIRSEVEKSGLAEALVEEEKTGSGRLWSRIVRARLGDGKLPFASSEIMPVYASYGMSRSRATTAYQSGSDVIADFMERVADDYEEIDRYGSIAVRWAWGLYVRWQERQQHSARSGPAASRSARRR